MITRAFIDARLPLPARVDVLIADPPRTGARDLPALVDRCRPGRVVLVSCDVATGAREIAGVVARGYRLHSVVPIDAFPRTSHVEWVARLDRLTADERVVTNRARR